jgi:hypothetical protein
MHPDSGGVLPLGQTSVAPGKGGGPSFFASQAQNRPLLPASAVPARDFLRVGDLGSGGYPECGAGNAAQEAPEKRLTAVLGEEPILLGPCDGVATAAFLAFLVGHPQIACIRRRHGYTQSIGPSRWFRFLPRRSRCVAGLFSFPGTPRKPTTNLGNASPPLEYSDA